MDKFHARIRVFNLGLVGEEVWKPSGFLGMCSLL